MADNNLLTDHQQPDTAVPYMMNPYQSNFYMVSAPTAIPMQYQQPRQSDLAPSSTMVPRTKQYIFSPELVKRPKDNFLFPGMPDLVKNIKKKDTQPAVKEETPKTDNSSIEKKVSKILDLKPIEDPLKTVPVAPKPVSVTPKPVPVAPKPVSVAPVVVAETKKEELVKKRIKYPRDLLIKLKTDSVTKELLFKQKPNGGNRRIDIDLGSVNLEKVEKPFIPSKNQNGAGESSSFESSVSILLNQIMPNNIQETHDKIEALCDRSDDNYEKFARILFNSAIKQAKFCHLFSELSSLFKEVASFRKTVITSCQKMLEKTLEDVVKDANKSVDDELQNINDENTRMIFQDNRDSVISKFKDNYFGNVRFYAELFKSEMISLVIFKKEFMKLALGDRLTVRNAEAFLIIYSTADSIVEKKISKEQLNEFFQKLKTLVDNSPDIESHIRFKINDVIDKRNSTKKKSDQSLNITEKFNLMPNQTWAGGLSNPSKSSSSWATSINKERTNSLTTSSRPSEPVTLLKKKSVTVEVDLERNYLQLFEDNDADYESYLEGLKKNNVNCQKVVANSLLDAMEKREPRRVACGKFLGHTLSKNLLSSSDIVDGFCDYLLTIDEDWYENYPCGMDYLGFILGHMMKQLGEKSDKFEILSKIADKAIPGENSEWSFGLQLIGKTVSTLNKIEAKEIISKIPNLTKSLENQVQKSSIKDLQRFLKECDIHQLIDNIPDQLPQDVRKTSIPSNSMTSSTSSINNTKTILKPPSHNQQIPPSAQQQPLTASNNLQQQPQTQPYSSNNSYQPPQQLKSLNNPINKKSMPNPHNPKQASIVNSTKVIRSNSYKMNLPTNANVVNSKGPLSRNTTDHRPHRNDYSTEQQQPHYNEYSQINDGFQKQMPKKQRNKNPTKNNNYSNRSEHSQIDEILAALTKKDNDQAIRLMNNLDNEVKTSEDLIRKFSSIVYKNALNLPKSEMEQSVEILRVIESDTMGRNHKVLLSELQLHSDHENIKNLVSTLVSKKLLSIQSVTDWYNEEPWLTEKYQTLHSVVSSLFPTL